MKYEKARAEVVKFDSFAEFIAGSMIGVHCDNYTDPKTGEHCGNYTVNVSCGDYDFDGGRHCGNYNGTRCSGYRYPSWPSWVPDCGYYIPIESCGQFSS